LPEYDRDAYCTSLDSLNLLGGMERSWKGGKNRKGKRASENRGIRKRRGRDKADGRKGLGDRSPTVHD